MDTLKPITKFFVLAYFFCGGITLSYAALVTDDAKPIRGSVTIQPIIVSDTDGANTATSFGTIFQQGAIETTVNTIWNQAGLEVNFLTPNTLDSSIANWGEFGPPNNNGQVRPGDDDLNEIRAIGREAGVINADPNVLNMYFVNITPAFDLTDIEIPEIGRYKATGFTFGDVNGSAIGISSGLLDTDLIGFRFGIESVGTLISHELGHALTLPHTDNLGFDDGTDNLLWSDGRTGQRLNDVQIAQVFNNSNISIAAVPLPAGVWLFGSALFALFGFTRRVKAY